MNSRTSFWLVGITTLVIALALYFQIQQPPASQPASIKSVPPRVVVTTQQSATELPVENALLPNTPPAVNKPKKTKPPAQDPAARAALSMVGKDATAELIWQEAINNLNLPKEERSDLIEDLNEDGFSNRKNPTPADLPLIEARLKIIERLMPEAADQTNLDAFAEARKDLINMQLKLAQ
jgi:hypothetical protein